MKSVVGNKLNQQATQSEQLGGRSIQRTWPTKTAKQIDRSKDERPFCIISIIVSEIHTSASRENRINYFFAQCRVLSTTNDRHKMSEPIGITEVQEIESEVKLLKRKLDDIRKSDNTSVSCSRIVSSVSSAQAKDGFLSTEGATPNQFHTSAGTAGESECCVIS